MGKKKKSNWDNMEPQKSSAAQYLTYIASYGITNEKFEIRYENENIWMSQKMLAAVYGVEVPNVAYHLRKLFADGEIDKETSIKEILIDVGDGRKFAVNHYNLQVIIALGFKIDNERAIAFRGMRVREVSSDSGPVVYERLRPLSPGLGGRGETGEGRSRRRRGK